MAAPTFIRAGAILVVVMAVGVGRGDGVCLASASRNNRRTTFGEQQRPLSVLNPYFMARRHDTNTQVGSDPISVLLADKIRTGGAVPYSELMRLALFEPSHGYYSASRRRIAADGDFFTAPEIASAFGGTIADLLGRVWTALGEPSRFDLLELGPGNGTLAFDIRHRIEQSHPALHRAIHHVVMDVSPPSEAQRARLGPYVDSVSWEVDGEPPKSGVSGAIVSNELFDTMPIERVIRLPGHGLLQKYVTIDDKSGTWVELWEHPSEELGRFVEQHHADLPEGIEIAANLELTQRLAPQIDALARGALLAFDYTTEYGNRVGVPAVGSFLRTAPRGRLGGYDVQSALRIYDFLGQIDITAFVDFDQLERQCKDSGLDVLFAGPQWDLLQANGIESVAVAMTRQAVRERKWSEILRAARASALGHLPRSYWALLASRGLDGNVSSLQKGTAVAEPDSQWPDLAVPVGAGRDSVRLVVRPSLLNQAHIYELKLPTKGAFVNVPLNLVERSTIETGDMGDAVGGGNDEILADFRQPEHEKHFVTQAGLEYDWDCD